MSESYPYLAIARKWNIDYGVVLCYADCITKRNLPGMTIWEQRAADQMRCHREAQLEIVAMVHKQKKLGVGVITDGEGFSLWRT